MGYQNLRAIITNNLGHQITASVNNSRKLPSTVRNLDMDQWHYIVTSCT